MNDVLVTVVRVDDDGDDAVLVKALANKTPPCLLDDDDDDFAKNVNKACVMTHKTVARCIICLFCLVLQ